MAQVPVQFVHVCGLDLQYRMTSSRSFVRRSSRRPPIFEIRTVDHGGQETRWSVSIQIRNERRIIIIIIFEWIQGTELVR
jgi:hypothetical protein